MQIISFKSLLFFQKRKEFFVWLMVLIVAFGWFGMTAKNWSQSFKFVDEDEYIANAYLMNEKGYVLYDSISTNHQPLPYILSVFLQSSFESENLFQLILSHRMLVWGWALLWSVILYFRFGKKIILPIFVFESIKYFTLGNQFVAESLAAYPFVYLSASFFEFMVDDDFLREDFFLGILSAMMVFFMLPLAIPMLLMALLRYYFSKAKELGEFIQGILILSLFVFFFVHPFDWLRETVWNNAKYAIPIISEISSVGDFLLLFLLPVTSIFTKKTILSQLIAFVSGIWWVSLGVLIKKKKYKQVLMWIVSFAIWGLANSRNIWADQMYYGAFHLTVWIFVGLVWGWWWLRFLDKKVISALIVFVFAGALFQKNIPWRVEKNLQQDHGVGYTNVYMVGRVISLLSYDDNSLMVVPNEALLHLASSAELATRQITYYEWHYHVPELQQTFTSTLENNLPEFVYFDESKSSYDVRLKKVLGEDYSRLHRVSGEETLLYQRSDVVKNLPSRRFAGLEALGYEFEDMD